LPKHEGFRFHDLRHTHASMLIAQGVNMKAISARLGHGSIGITMDTYGHLYANHEEEMMAGIEAAYQSAASAQRRVSRIAASAVAFLDHTPQRRLVENLALIEANAEGVDQIENL